jgi:hypothetical protein
MGEATGGPRRVLRWDTRKNYIGLTGGKIMPAHICLGGIKRSVQVMPGFSSFKLVVPL